MAARDITINDLAGVEMTDRRRRDRATAGGLSTTIILDALESLLAKDRVHHDAIVETLAAMPPIVVVAAYLEFTANVLAEL
ncbi:hypothetical protein CRV24_009458 [Beauveria bassiana]|nr:hypothetical protein CRV24_009458 [Beauveria bassiana]